MPTRRLVLAALCSALIVPGLAAQSKTKGTEGLLAGLDARRDRYANIAHQIWGFAELGYQESRSSALLQKELQSAGFEVKSGVAGIPTAFVASYGSGKPIIGIVGEF